MKAALSHRKGIPFFSSKTEKDFRADPYERYDEVVLRQVAVHYADALWGRNPMQALHDFAEAYYPKLDPENIMELGCGVGHWTGLLANRFPKSNCWGLDYSYQMLKTANDFLVLGKDMSIDLSKKGFEEQLLLQGKKIPNLHFGLCDAAELPCADKSQDLILHSFLFDRLERPMESLNEIRRVLRSKGRMIMFNPLNFKQAEDWKQFHPASKLQTLLGGMGFNILAWKEGLVVDEPLDARGNVIRWNCLAAVMEKI